MDRKRNKFSWKSSFLAFIFSANLFLVAEIDQSIFKHKNTFEEIALEIWDLAEVGYQEYESSRILREELAKNGFNITENVADIPTAFIAEYGSKGPVIGILGEFDALPGIVQTDSPFRELRDDRDAGHACGHHLFGAASAWAAVAVKEWLDANKIKGRIRFYGTPAEEGGSGKVYMVRGGLFDDVDIVLHWHPSSVNQANPRSSNANKSAKFRFKGISAHAAGSPDKGRSALDGVEAMNHMVNMMREHIPQESRMHYVITQGGFAPNVVPDSAEVYYYIRHPKMNVVEELFQRVVKISEGAALGTGTTVTHEVIHGNFSLLPNNTLQELMHKNLTKRGGVQYDEKELAFAEEIYATLIQPGGKLGDQEKIREYKYSHGYGSTDVGDVSWNVPTGEVRTATWVPGTAAHSWQAIAAGGTTIGLKGTKLAAEVLADTAIALFKDQKIIQRAKKELLEKQGPEFDYYPLLGERPPPLDYRK